MICLYNDFLPALKKMFVNSHHYIHIHRSGRKERTTSKAKGDLIELTRAIQASNIQDGGNFVQRTRLSCEDEQ